MSHFTRASIGRAKQWLAMGVISLCAFAAHAADPETTTPAPTPTAAAAALNTEAKPTEQANAPTDAKPAETMAATPTPAAVAAPAPAPAPAPAAGAAPAKPSLPAGWAMMETINTGDTAWMLASCALVLLMTMPGLALFYGGMARTKNVINTFMLVFCSAVISAAIWMAVGYSLAFAPGNGFIGGLSKAFMFNIGFSKNPAAASVHELATNIPEAVFAMFQMTFAMITPALIIGAFVERVKFSAAMIFIAIWDLLVYAPVAHWVWGPGGWLGAMGALDFAGGTVVHIASGTAGLAFALIAGRRNGFPEEPMPPSNLSLTLAGACMLWVGWFGFNAGSANSAGAIAGSAMIATQIAAVFGTLSWVAVEWIKRGKPTILGAATGAIAGLVAVTPAAGFISPVAAIVLGIAGGVGSWFGATTLKRIMKIDDSLDAFGVHGVAGIIGTVLTGVLASAAMSGINPSVLTQLVAMFAVATWSFFVSLVVLVIMSRTIGLRVSSAQESKGLDISLHGESIEH